MSVSPGFACSLFTTFAASIFPGNSTVVGTSGLIGFSGFSGFVTSAIFKSFPAFASSLTIASNVMLAVCKPFNSGIFKLNPFSPFGVTAASFPSTRTVLRSNDNSFGNSSVTSTFCKIEPSTVFVTSIVYVTFSPGRTFSLLIFFTASISPTGSTVTGTCGLNGLSGSFGFSTSATFTSVPASTSSSTVASNVISAVSSPFKFNSSSSNILPFGVMVAGLPSTLIVPAFNFKPFGN